MPKLSYLKALNRALGDELDRDPAVFLLGEDIRAAASNLTAGLFARFGRTGCWTHRCPSRRSPTSPPARHWPDCDR